MSHMSTPVHTRPAVAFFDVDGTLVFADKDALERMPREAMNVCPPPFKRDTDAIRAMLAAGNLAFLCTGRALCNLHPDLLDLPWSGTITLYGGRVTLGDEVLRDYPFTDEQLKELIDGLCECKGNACIAGTDTCVETCDGIRTQGSWPKVASLEDLRKLYPHTKFGKVFLDFEAGEALLSRPVVRDELSYMPRLGANFPWSEFCPKENDKMLGVRTIMQRLGDSVGTSYGFGDSDLDLPLLRECDIAVSVENATEALKAESDYISSAVTEGGVAQALEHFGLCG